MFDQGYAAHQMDLPHDAEHPAAEPLPRPPLPLPAPPVFMPPALPQTYDLAPAGFYTPRLQPPPDPGQFTPAWRTLFIAGWIGVLLGFAAVWQACRVAGIAPWWLGPETNQRAFVIIALPFVAPITAVVAGIARFRVACYIGVAAGIVTLVVALGDRNRFPGVAAVEAAIGCAGLLISVGAFAGRMRRPR
ncbi:unannotated protein [freshwater metagenome]|uniref:Unannotated protein n=1 Tax=freshwater metagenome TaxID=449393 RepID=A0A6J6WZK7_9ZZZZ